MKNVRADIPISIFLLVAVGESNEVMGIANKLRGGYLANFMGEPEKVIESLGKLESLGIDRVQLTEFTPRRT